MNIPSVNVARSKIADLTSGPSVLEQWKAGGLESKYAWEGTNGCFSETIYNKSDVIFQQAYCKSALKTYNKALATASQCTTVKSNVTSSLVLQGLQATFTVSEGTSTDPFIPSSTDEFNVYRSATENDWLWIRKSDNQIVYWQQYRTDVKKILVHFFGSFNDDGTVESTGFTGKSEKPSYWDFKVFDCVK